MHAPLRLTAELRAILSRLVAVLLAFHCIPTPVGAQIFPYPKPINPRQFAIMAWGNSPSDPGQLAMMKLAGFNISGFCTLEDLANVRDAGLTCFLSDPRANGYDWNRAPPATVLDRNASDLKRSVGGNPAVLGFLLADEPDGAMLTGLAEVAAALKRQMPDMWPYVNAFPFAAAPMIQPLSYDDYLRAQVRQIGQPFISYDHYAVVGGEILDSFFTNLQIVRRVSLEMKVPFWNCILANAHSNFTEPSEASLSVQVYGTLAFGGRGIEYFTYVTPDSGNYRAAAIDRYGVRTPTWEILRRLNGELAALAPLLTSLHSTGVFRYPTPPPGGEPPAQSSLIEFVETPGYLRAPAVPRLVIGELADDNDHQYLILVNVELATSVPVRIHLKNKARNLRRISPYSGAAQPSNQGIEWLAPGAGIVLSVN